MPLAGLANLQPPMLASGRRIEGPRAPRHASPSRASSRRLADFDGLWRAPWVNAVHDPTDDMSRSSTELCRFDLSRPNDDIAVELDAAFDLF
jgi:hypothetical protein